MPPYPFFGGSRILWEGNTEKNQKCTFDGILQLKMIPNGEDFTCIFVWMCVSTI